MEPSESNPSDQVEKNLPGNRAIDDPGWSAIEDKYCGRQGSAASSNGRAEIKWGMPFGLHPRPGYQGETSLKEGKCRKKGSNRISRSQ